MNHTKGPWKADESRAVRKHVEIFSQSTGRRIARMIRHPGDEPETPMSQFTTSAIDKQDAQLIAAAPELYELLSKINEAFYTRSTKKQWLELMEQTKPLLQKARGEKENGKTHR